MEVRHEWVQKELPLFVYEECFTKPSKKLINDQEPFSRRRRHLVKFYHVIETNEQQLLVSYDAHMVGVQYTQYEFVPIYRLRHNSNTLFDQSVTAQVHIR